MPAGWDLTQGSGAATSGERIRVVIVEDEGLYRDLLATALSRHPRIEVARAFGDAGSALEVVPSLDPHVAILDIQLGGPFNGIHLGLRLRRDLPGLGVVLLSNHADPDFLMAVPQEELSGWSYLLKRSVGDLATLERAVEGSAAGLVVLDPQLTRGALAQRRGGPASLTPRQREIWALIAQGYTNTAIAEKLHLSPKSVENHINLLYQELDIDSADRTVHPRVKAVLRYLKEPRA
ncbi:response regulator transcription factor [Carboxydochorda subterranea]|uniref:Response regulator transcription factor n=1 Tax=Carboxydichorda subterranea TaxID=3109565 RepID=A0ABZ1BZF6_9FIRM|nr:response regulator transcription factor [Limnochorda sp. L945t]WRP17473.1 response regulator transcription factor [Limnochorda sp. L945t]